MSVRLILGGVDDLRAALRQLPDDLAGEAGATVRDAATGAHRDVDAVFAAHRVSGNLADHSQLVEVAGGRFGSILRVVNRAHHAWWFEHGTQARHWRNGKLTGQTKGAHMWAGTMITRRATMWATLRRLVENHGLKVTGDV